MPDASDPSNEGSLLYEFLSKILRAENAFDHIKDAIPQKGLEYHSTEKPVYSDLVLVGYADESKLQLIADKLLYYVPAALVKGSINLVSGFEKTNLLLHNDLMRLMVRLKGEGPRFFPLPALKALGFNPTRAEYYLGFDIKDMTPIKGLDPNNFVLRKIGNRNLRSPNFISLEKLINK